VITTTRAGKKKVFFVAATIRGGVHKGIAFGSPKDSVVKIAIKACKQITDSPIDSVLVFNSADSYYLKQRPVAFTLSRQAQERRVYCFEHRESPPEMKGGLPDCFECREDILQWIMRN